MNLYTTLLHITLFLSGLTDFVRRFNLGSISALGVLTVLLALASWVLVFSRPKMPKTVLNVSGLIVFILVQIIIWIWYMHTNTLPVVSAIQNLSVFVGFVGFIVLSSIQSYRTFDLPQYMSLTFTRSAKLSVIIYGFSILISGPGSSMLMSARSFALFAIVGLSWFVGMWRYRLPGGLLWGIGTVLTIAFSFSRTALIISILLFPICQTSLATVKGWLRMIFTILLIVTVSYLAFNYVQPIRDRFTSVGDNATVGGVQVNTSGRNDAWQVAYASAIESPWIGKGPGSVTNALVASGSNINHPHNDYLRIFHDYGLIGLILWLLGYGGLIVKSWQNWQWADRNDKTNAHIHLAAFLALVAVALAMVTDNIVVYIFAMNPLGILLGASLGSASRRKKDIKLARNLAHTFGNLGNLAT
ncbi:O-antigen ligase family protein [Aetokthonos hydrillicola Thurmond2011]|jgi:O-antigen ligase|uniref:O-antigen ligase family protein n=1 Tax=Aetokthonos hydrillicola Thurmond2011 TaxID=2712845 RepID=A0AAP5M9I4_9CYAN|nr:O-antigen ligase family protein [Aetokthonos hydrillicola]MBO3457595.1 O-antigen ligase family protein [Aetokthonos hydrillicola CCALA 1050]MBW4587873.1 O-antigen ligase family protein [Aetokthonos hydrillicola CCALA 1050]MDR9894723.1 O-antigen ligase family protein [Aetokthonos hydrillicola Thurmond2011]